MLEVDFRSKPSLFAEAEALYLGVRKAEGRVLSIEALQALPRVAPSDPHAREWQIRTSTADRLIRRLRRRENPPHILDLGCGPGWMIARLVTSLGATGVGVDCNRSELERGAQAFAAVQGLELVYGNIFESIVPDSAFDTIIVASVLQYFSDPSVLIERLQALIKPDGEILIADTPLYRRDEIPAAAERTRSYYTGIGFPQMAEHYHHHALAELAPFNPECLYDPRKLLNQIGRKLLRRPLSPFPVLKIGKAGRP